MLRLRPSFLPAALLVALASGCGDDEADPSVVTPAVEARASASVDARLEEARLALMRGETDVARALAAKLPEGGVAEGVLRARLAFVLGDEVEALERVEELKLEHPEDGRPYATAAELHAARGRALDAQEEIRRGWAAAGRTAELERARGVLALSRPGGSAEGVAALLAARELDPDVPYVELPLSQANLLLGRSFLGEALPELAEEHARRALAFDPLQVEGRELLAEALAAQLRFGEALVLYDELADEGRELTAVRVDLRAKAATAALLRGERDAALDHWVAARALGASDVQLGFGAQALVDAANEAVDAGVARLREDAAVGAREHLERAVALVPDHLEAWSWLGHARFRADDHAGAAAAWGRVIALAGDAELPEPVVVHRAKALRLAGDLDGAIALLEDELRARPAGRWRLEAGDALSSFLAERGDDD